MDSLLYILYDYFWSALEPFDKKAISLTLKVEYKYNLHLYASSNKKKFMVSDFLFGKLDPPLIVRVPRIWKKKIFKAKLIAKQILI